MLGGVGLGAGLLGACGPAKDLLQPEKLPEERIKRIQNLAKRYETAKRLGYSDKSSATIAVGSFLGRTDPEQVAKFHQEIANKDLFGNLRDEDVIVATVPFAIGISPIGELVKTLFGKVNGFLADTEVGALKVAQAVAQDYTLAFVDNISQEIGDALGGLFGSDKIVVQELTSLSLSGISDISRSVENFRAASGISILDKDVKASILVMAMSLGLTLQDVKYTLDSVSEFGQDLSGNAGGTIDASLVLAYAMEKRRNPGATLTELLAAYSKIKEESGAGALESTIMILGLVSEETAVVILATSFRKSCGKNCTYNCLTPLAFKKRP